MTLSLTACGMGFKVADPDAERDGHKPDKNFEANRVDQPDQALRVVTPGSELQTNDLAAANVSRLTAAFTYAPQAKEELSVRVTRLKANTCRDGRADLRLVWRTTDANGQAHDRTIESTAAFTVEPGGEQRLVVTLEPAQGLCKTLQLSFVAQAHPL
jgi:hypothetical protein